MMYVNFIRVFSREFAVLIQFALRGAEDGWADWVIVHPGFGRIECGSGGAPHYHLPT